MNQTPGGLDPRFIASLLTLLTQPSCQCEIWLTVFYPDVKKDFDKWLRLQIQPNPGDVYDWLQKKFPKAPIRTPDMADPDEGFRLLLKAIIASIFNLDMQDVPKLDLSATRKH